MSQFDDYEIELPSQNVLEKNPDSIWSTYQALQTSEAERAAKLT
jgi:hypothetical protein